MEHRLYKFEVSPELEAEFAKERAERKKAIAEAKPVAQTILDYWNSIDVFKHSTTLETKELQSFVEAIATKRIDTAKLVAAIDGYKQILCDESYFFKYKWTLGKFALRISGADRSNKYEEFMEGGIHYENYMAHLKSIERKQAKEQPQVKAIESLPEEIQVDLASLNSDYIRMINKLRFMPYEEYLLTDHWTHFRSQAIKNANGKCVLCGKSEEELHVHHNNYENRGRETFNDVIVLCKGCHAKFHGKGEV